MLMPIFPSLTSRFVTKSNMEYLHSSKFNGATSLFSIYIAPWIFVDYDLFRKDSDTRYEYYIIVFSAIVHEVIHLLSFVFIDHMCIKSITMDIYLQKEIVPVTVQAAILWLMVKRVRNNCSWSKYKRWSLNICTNVSRSIFEKS
jgi:hypothetical protein